MFIHPRLFRLSDQKIQKYHFVTHFLFPLNAFGDMPVCFLK